MSKEAKEPSSASIVIGSKSINEECLMERVTVPSAHDYYPPTWEMLSNYVAKQVKEALETEGQAYERIIVEIPTEWRKRQAPGSCALY